MRPNEGEEGQGDEGEELPALMMEVRGGGTPSQRRLTEEKGKRTG